MPIRRTPPLSTSRTNCRLSRFPTLSRLIRYLRFPRKKAVMPSHISYKLDTVTIQIKPIQSGRVKKMLSCDLVKDIFLCLQPKERTFEMLTIIHEIYKALTIRKSPVHTQYNNVQKSEILKIS